MKKLIIALAIIGLLLTTGCISATTPPVSEPIPLPTPPIPSTPAEDNGIEANTSNSDEVILPGSPPEDMTWISPGKVMVGNFYPGARAEWLLQIHNGNDTTTFFSVAYRYPDHVEEGYVKPLPETQDWIIIADATPVLMPRETREVMIILDMPHNAKSPGEKWEFWVSIKDTTQTGMVQVELCTRWLISMR